ncbi:MAG TPA: diacylglycerol kinase family protein [Thermodesulfobacteriota bacterium]|nr:hypothetical protein [Deltaproteobacteria bacterium]HNU71821.1 diacylglycerol kinase family protein [Thermodesulfobacteriota bacterium]HQO77365.1 diacylglycerol kinase family protein [Thermodesulfobacteriota bacterium]
MSKVKLAFLLNPRSGGGRAEVIGRHIPQCLHTLGISTDQYHIVTTEGKDIAAEARLLASKAERLIAVGGDGTAVAAIAGVHASQEDVSIGIIPLGVGNDLARLINAYQLYNRYGLARCLKAFLEALTVPLDLWEVNGHVMVNYLSVGFDAAVVSSFQRCRQRGKRSIASEFMSKCLYAIVAAVTLFSGVRSRIVLRVEAGGESRTLSYERPRQLTVSNIASYAGGTLPAPQTDHHDRLLDITVFPSILHLGLLFAVQPLERLQRYYGNRLLHTRAERLEMEIAPGNCLQIDGEDKSSLLSTGTLRIEYAGQVSVLQIAAEP